MLSMLLLFAYSLGMAHSLIPHCHHGLQTTTEDHQHLIGHLHHEHKSNEHETHDYVSHGGHLDEGLFDLLVCILSEVEQPQAEYHCSPTLPAVQSSVWAQADLSVPFVIVLFDVLFNAELEPASVISNHEVVIDYQSADATAFPHRGPPVLS